jgi:predicted CoA-binding protein
MNEESSQVSPPDDLKIRNILQNMKRIAVVGISDKEERASHGVAKFLVGQGFEVVGVNPKLEEVLGVKVYPNLNQVPGRVDVVDIFRKNEAVPQIVDEAIQINARVIWMQEGVVHQEAAAKAEAAGLDVVMDRCLYQEWLRLMNP